MAEVKPLKLNAGSQAEMSPTADSLRVNSLGVGQAASATSGYVLASRIGLGTTTPSYEVSAEKSADNTTPLVFARNSSAGTGAAGFVGVANGGLALGGIGTAGTGWTDPIGIAADANMTFVYGSQGIALGTLAGFELRLSSGGTVGLKLNTSADPVVPAGRKLGVGTTSPSTLLQLGTSGSVKGVASFAGDTSGLVTLQPASVAGTWTLTLPTTAGTAGRVLQTDGTGVTTWAVNAASVDIGSSIPSGNPDYVLFVGAGPVLAQDSGFQFNAATTKMVLGGVYDETHAFVDVQNGSAGTSNFSCYQATSFGTARFGVVGSGWVAGTLGADPRNTLITGTHGVTINTDSGYELRLSSNSTVGFMLNAATGNPVVPTGKFLGIGVDPPAYQLDIRTNIASNIVTAFLYNSNAGTGAGTRMQVANDIGATGDFGIVSSTWAGGYSADPAMVLIYGSNGIAITTQAGNELRLADHVGTIGFKLNTSTDPIVPSGRKLGVGTNAPSWQVHVEDSSNTYLALAGVRNLDSNSGAAANFVASNDIPGVYGYYGIVSSTWAGGYGALANNAIIHATHGLTLNVGAAMTMRFCNNGTLIYEIGAGGFSLPTSNLAIGVASPSYILDIQGTTVVNPTVTLTAAGAANQAYWRAIADDTTAVTFGVTSSTWTPGTLGADGSYGLAYAQGGLALNVGGAEMRLCYSGTERITIDATGIGFFNTAPVAQQTVAAITNNVTAGGTNDVINDIVTGGVVGTDVRDALYQLARTLDAVVTALRNYGLAV